METDSQEAAQMSAMPTIEYEMLSSLWNVVEAHSMSAV